MKLTAQAKLTPTEAQAKSLKRTMGAANTAANFASRLAWDNRVFGRVPLQKLVYHPIRQEFGVSAQSACLIVRKVADAYKLDKKTIREFRPLGAVAFDDRILAWKLDKQTVSIWTMDGRLTIPFVAGGFVAGPLGVGYAVGNFTHPEQDTGADNPAAAIPVVNLLALGPAGQRDREPPVAVVG